MEAWPLSKPSDEEIVFLCRKLERTDGFHYFLAAILEAPLIAISKGTKPRKLSARHYLKTLLQEIHCPANLIGRGFIVIQFQRLGPISSFCLGDALTALIRVDVRKGSNSHTGVEMWLLGNRPFSKLTLELLDLKVELRIQKTFKQLIVAPSAGDCKVSYTRQAMVLDLDSGHRVFVPNDRFIPCANWCASWSQ